MPDQDALLLTGGPVEIAAAGKPPTVTILAYSGNLMNVPGWGPIVIDLAGLDLSASQVRILADHDASLKGIVGHGQALVRDGNLIVSGTIAAATDAAQPIVALAKIGRLRAIGFRRRRILFSFLLESVLLCLAGGLLGCLATLPFNGLSTGTANWATFSEITFSFRFGPRVLLQGLLLAVTMGVLGGLFPAVRAVRMKIVNALREQ